MIFINEKEKNMKLVLLSGGVGTRLWPVSDSNHPKQFLKIFDNGKTSMLQKTYENVKKLKLPIYIASQNKWSKTICEQIGDNVKIINEPCLMDTFAAILNIAEYLYYEENASENEIVAVIPTDHFVQSEFYNLLDKCHLTMLHNHSEYGLIGINPKFASSKYGYICRKNNIVKRFVEKPKINDAKELIKQGALWNSGVLLFKIGAVLKEANNIFKYNSYNEFLNKYEQLPKISFDYAVLEHENNISIVDFEGKWDDLGTWKSLSKYVSKEDSNNNNVINYEDKLIKVDNAKDLIVVNSENGLLIESKDNVVYKRWGSYEVLSDSMVDDISIKTKILNIDDEKNLSYQRHKYREEIWYVICGIGEIYVGKNKSTIKQGDLVHVRQNELHCIKGINNLKVFEIQKGSITEENDIERLEYEWEKIQDY